MEDGEDSVCSIESLGGVAILDCMCLSMGHDVVDWSYPYSELAP